MTFITQKLSGGRFLVIGRAGMDLYADPPGARIEAATRFTSALGGSSANIAVALCRHGLSAALLTRVSDDAVGRFCLAQLAGYGVQADLIATQQGEARNSLAVVETRIENCQSVIYRNHAADFQMTVADVEAVDFTAFDAVITTGTVLAAEPSRSATFHAFDRARVVGLPLIFDVDYRPYSWASADEAANVYSRAASYCDIIIGNDVEFGFMAGGYDRGLDKARALAREEGRLVIYKMGEGGAITLSGTEEFRIGIYGVQALKPTGAGDAFMGGFVAALSKGGALRDAVLAGSACAAIVVTRVGCAPAMPDPTELAAFLRDHPGPTLP
jgi:5-dehydro-2-deoxygluconokinase